MFPICSYLSPTFIVFPVAGGHFLTQCSQNVPGFCLGNVIKYAKRYGKKQGKNDLDLLKIIHYTIILLGSKNEAD